MDTPKQMLHQQLVANVIKDKCATTPGVLFDEALCSQHKCIRFKTERLAEYFPDVLYEVFNYGNRLEIYCGASFGKWELSGETPQELLEQFDAFLKALPQFEEELTEGTQKTLCTKRYERSRKARQACLAHYGYSCKICGLNFALMYGPQFGDIIEVHHVVPVSQIGKNYVVDPIKDLIPVCSNCHTALHSKPNGTYTTDELKNAIKNKGKAIEGLDR